MADLKYRADSDESAVQAVVVLLQTARSGTEDFTFGPTDWKAIRQQGLTITGDTDAVKPLLEAVPGLVGVDA